MRPCAFGKVALVALLVSLPAGARARFAEAVRAYEAGDYATAFAEWLPLAEGGDPAAERNIGHLYRMGWSVPQDFEEAADWYQRAAEKGFARAQANLANMYLRGQGRARDYAMAVEWFRRAALQGHAVAQYNLGLMYENGLGAEQSDAKAMGWYHLASRTGHRRAEDKLALLIAKSTSELGASLEDLAASEPVEVAEPAEVAEPLQVAEAPAMEGPRREPVEVVLDEREPDPDAAAGLEMAVIEPASGEAAPTTATPVEEEVSRGDAPEEAVPEAAVPADAGEAAEIEDEEPDLLSTVLKALKGESRRERKARREREAGADAEPGDGMAVTDVADADESAAAGEGESEEAGSPTADPDTAEAQEPDGAEMQMAGEPPVDWDEPADEAPAVLELAAVIPAEPPAVEEDAADLAAVEEDRPGFLDRFLRALKGQSRREREAARAATDAAAAPMEMAGLDPARDVAVEDTEAPRDGDEDFAGLARDALGGEARASEATLDAEAATAAEDMAAPIDAAGADDAPGSGEPLPEREGPAVLEEEESEAATLEPLAVAAMEDDGETGVAVVWEEAGEVLAEMAPAPEPGPPLEVAASEDSVTALPVVAVALGAGADLGGMSDLERLRTGLAAYRARDYAGAVIAWLPLAERGNAMGQFYIGGLYLDGTGLPPSRVWAHVFWTLAAEQDQVKAGELLAVLSADMLPVELAEARDLAAAWRPTP